MNDTLKRQEEGADRSRQRDVEGSMRSPRTERAALVGWERDTGRRNAPGWLSLDE